MHPKFVFDPGFTTKTLPDEERGSDTSEPYSPQMKKRRKHCKLLNALIISIVFYNGNYLLMN